MSKKETGKPIPQDWDGESYSLYMLCAPDSVMWHGFVKGAIYELTKGWGWNGNTGSVIEATAIAKEIHKSMAKCDDLVNMMRVNNAILAGESLDLNDDIPETYDYTETGIGPILQALRQLEDDKYFDLDDFITALAANPFDTTKDLLEMATFIKELSPIGFKIDIGQAIRDFKTNRFRAAIHDQIMDIALSQRSQAIAQGGQDFAGTYDAMNDVVDAALLPSGITGKVKWLWAKTEWNDIPSWIGWFGTITGLVLGNIRAAIYDVGAAIEEKEIVPSFDLAVTSLVDAIENKDIGTENLDQSLATIKAAIEAIETQNNINVDVSCQSCGGSGGCGCAGGGTDIPLDEFDGDGPAPEGFEAFDDPPGSSGYIDEVCKRSNYVFDQLSGYILALNQAGVDGYTAFTIVAVTTIIFELATPFPLIDGILGLVVGLLGTLALVVLRESLELGNLRLLMLNNREELVCKIYSNKDANQAKEEFLQVLRDEGMQTGQEAFLHAIFAVEMFKWVWFKDKYHGAVEQALVDYVPPTPCTACCSHGITIGTDSLPYGFIDSDTGSTVTLSSNFSDGEERVHIAFLSGCPTSTISNITITSGSVQNGGINYRIFSEAAHTGSVGDIYADDPLPAGSYDDVRAIAVNSDTPFSVSIQYVPYVAP